MSARRSFLPRFDQRNPPFQVEELADNANRQNDPGDQVFEFNGHSTDTRHVQELEKDKHASTAADAKHDAFDQRFRK